MKAFEYLDLRDKMIACAKKNGKSRDSAMQDFCMGINAGVFYFAKKHYKYPYECTKTVLVFHPVFGSVYDDESISNIGDEYLDGVNSGKYSMSYGEGNYSIHLNLFSGTKKFIDSPEEMIKIREYFISRYDFLANNLI